MVAKAIHEQQNEYDREKAWTVMVYMVADTTLINFAIESLKQMKASQHPQINIVAELDCGRGRSTERYCFGKHCHKKQEENSLNVVEDYLRAKQEHLSSIVNDIVLRLEPQDPGDPETLTNFIDWSVQKYPAKRYFLIIWGHGSGIDDDSFNAQNTTKQEALEQDRNDRFYIPRHYPLPTTNIQLSEASLKSLTFVDSPISYLTNEALKKALEDAQTRLTPPEDKDKNLWRLHVLGMDACNMNLIELGYEIRKYADYLIASQDEIPDASWPYYNILSKLAIEVEILDEEKLKERYDKQKRAEKSNDTPSDIYIFVQKIAEAYTEAYQDYVDQPVALSALDLRCVREEEEKEGMGAKLRPLFEPFIKILQLHTKYREINDAIVFARRRVRSFYTRIPSTHEFHTRDIYIDLIHFCRLLSSFLEKHPQHKNFQDKISTFIKELTKIIAVNEKSKGEEECNGTSIYFPATSDDEFGSFYEVLEFAQETHWGAFVTKFLEKNPDLFIPPKFDRRAGGVKGDPHNYIKGVQHEIVKGNPRVLDKGNPRVLDKGNPRVLDKLAQIMVPGGNPTIANHSSQENISPSIYNVIYNYGTIVEVGGDENVEGE